MKNFVALTISLPAICLLAASCSSQTDSKPAQNQLDFVATYPDGWTAEGGQDGRALIHSADGTQFALVQPFQNQTGQALDTVGTLLPQLTSLLPGATISESRQVSLDPNEAVAKLTYTANGQPGQANVLCIESQGKGVLYAIAAPAAQFAAQKSALLGILRSFKYSAPTSTGTSDTTSPGELSFTTWKEPNEGMFTTSVPSGWKVIGGAYRFAPVDVRVQVSLVSPDGLIDVQNGAAKLTALVNPGPSSQIRNLGEGGQYEVNGVTYTVMTYETGVDFSTQFVNMRMKQDHPDIQVTGSKERPDLETKVNSKLQNGVTANVGETDFTCSVNGQSRQGACYAATVQLSQSGGMWQAFPSYIIAPADKMDVAWQVLDHFITDRQDDPEWTAHQSQVTAEFNQMVMQNHEAAMAQLHEQYEKAVSQLDENFRGWDNVINGTTDVRDPNTGATANVPVGSNYYWRNGAGDVVGTNTYNPPGINFDPLEQY